MVAVAAANAADDRVEGTRKTSPNHSSLSATKEPRDARPPDSNRSLLPSHLGRGS
jgi:hypothetical protein